MAISEVLLGSVQSQIQTLSKGSNLAKSVQKGTPRVNPSLLANPIVPGVVVKPNAQKANKQLGKKKTEGSKSKPTKKEKGNFERDYLEMIPSKLEKNKLSQPTPDEHRATDLKRSYPGIKGVGKAITRKRRKQLIAQQNENLVLAMPPQKVPSGPKHSAKKQKTPKDNFSSVKQLSGATTVPVQRKFTGQSRSARRQKV